MGGGGNPEREKERWINIVKDGLADTCTTTLRLLTRSIHIQGANTAHTSYIRKNSACKKFVSTQGHTSGIPFGLDKMRVRRHTDRDREIGGSHDVHVDISKCLPDLSCISVNKRRSR